MPGYDHLTLKCATEVDDPTEQNPFSIKKNCNSIQAKKIMAMMNMTLTLLRAQHVLIVIRDHSQKYQENQKSEVRQNRFSNLDYSEIGWDQ